MMRWGWGEVEEGGGDFDVGVDGVDVGWGCLLWSCEDCEVKINCYIYIKGIEVIEIFNKIYYKVLCFLCGVFWL